MTNKHCLSEQQLALYVFGELPGEQHRRADAHLADCPDCRRRQASLAEVRARLPRDEMELSAAEERQFAARVAAAAQRRKAGSRLQAWGAAATAVAAGAIALAIFTPDNVTFERAQQSRQQLAEIDLVEHMEMLEELELLEMMELLEMLEGKG